MLAEKARAALRVEETCASACVIAMNTLFSNDWLVWEPETLWIELHYSGMDVPVGNRGQILAARSLVTTGRFWYDAHAFAATCITFNNEEALHVGIENAPACYMNWAVFEAEKIYRSFEELQTLPEIDREPVKYTAVTLHLEAFVLAPEHLKFAQIELDKLYASDTTALRLEIQKGWAAAPKGKELDVAPFPESAAGVQLARLAAVQRYFDKRQALRERQLAELKMA